MPITSGVRAVQATISVGGATVPIIGAVVNQSGTRKTSRMSCGVALKSFPGEDQFFSQVTSNEITLMVSGQTLFDGEIDSFDIGMGLGVVSILTRDHSVKLHEQKSSEKFTNQKRSEIVQTIAKRNGLTAQIQGAASLLAGKTFQIDYVKLTDSISDAAILHKMAELDGVGWFVKGKTLYYGGGSGGGGYQITYVPGQPDQSNCLALNVYWNMQAAKNITVNVNSWNQKQKKAITSTKTAKGNDGQQTYNYRAAGLEQDHADDLAKHKLAEHIRHEYTINVEMVGDPTLDPSQTIQLQGNAFAQSYDIDNICHRIASHGYTMNITAKSAKQGRSSDGG